jgi:MFS family permease
VIQRVFKAFQYRDFRLQWMGACTSAIGTWMQIVAQGWLIYRLSHSAWLLALDQFLGTIPIFLFSLVGGVIADRIDRRQVLIGSQCVQMTCASTLTVLVITNVVQPWMILSLSFFTGLAQAFGAPAYQALIPMLVNKEDMPNAIALNSMQFNLAMMIGPALGGQALAHLGEKWCFGLNAFSFLAPIVALTLLKVRFQPQKTGESILASMKEGIRFVRKQSAMEALMILAFCMTALGTPMRTFFPVFAKDIFHRGPEAYSMFFTVMALGSIAGSLALAGLGDMQRKGRVALIFLLCLGGSIAGFALSRSLSASYVLLFVAGTSMIAVFTSVATLVQLNTANEVRARVMSVYSFAFRGGMPMGNLLAGKLVPIFSAPTVLAANGMILMLVALYFLTVHRRVAAL